MCGLQAERQRGKRQAQDALVGPAAVFNHDDGRVGAAALIEQALRSDDRFAPAHVLHQRVGVGHLHVILPGMLGRGAGREKRHAAGHAAPGQWLFGRCCRRQRGRDAGHYFDLDTGFFQRPQFFIGTAEQHRIAALQAHHHGVFARTVEHLLVDEGLGGRQSAAALADRDLDGLRAQCQHVGRHQRVVQHDAGLRQQPRAAQSDQILGAGSGAHQIDFSEYVHADSSAQAPSRIMPAATVWCVTSSIKMKAPVARMSS